MNNSMLFDIVSPEPESAVFEAPDLQIAALTMFLLTNGQYGADCMESDLYVPVFLAGGALEWWRSQFDGTIEGAVVARAAEVADALESLHCRDCETLQPVDSTLKERASEIALLLRQKYAKPLARHVTAR